MNDEKNKISRTLELLRIAHKIKNKAKYDMSLFTSVSLKDILLAMFIDELQQREK